jgi:dipeptidase
MCDTLVALSNVTKDGSVIFGKNSDREPNEPQVMIRIPSKVNQTRDKLKCTYIEVNQKEATNEVILIKPHWIWGGEMGINSKGLVIGNEAVFLKEKLEQEALLGMDMLRLALECCDNAAYAVELIINLLERYGQGGKAGYTANLRYHSSFIIADHLEAYLLETAGKHWAMKKINDFCTISNALTIENNFDRCSNELIQNAMDKKWCKSEADFNYKSCYEDKLYSFATQGDYRQKYTEGFINNNAGSFDVNSMKSILRNHCDIDKVKHFKAGSMKSVCMHGGGIVSSQTTSSMIAHLKDENITLWGTETSLPCVSLYKPYWFTANSKMFFSENEQPIAVEHWKQVEKLHRLILNGEIEGLSNFINERDNIEAKLLKMANEVKSDDDKIELMNYAKVEEQKLYNGLLDNLSDKHQKSKKSNSNLYYNWYWKRQNNELDK